MQSAVVDQSRLDILQVNRWMMSRLGGERAIFLAELLVQYDCFLAGRNLLQVITTGNFDVPLQVYASVDAVKLLVSVFRGLQRLPMPLNDNHTNLLARNGINVVLTEADAIEVFVCKNPREAIRNPIVNHYKVYCDARRVYREALSQPLQLGDAYVREYIHRNPAVLREVTSLTDAGHVLTINILPEQLGPIRVYDRSRYSTPADQSRVLTKMIYFGIIDDIFAILSDYHATVLLCESCPLEFTFEEMVRKLNSVKQFFLPKSYGGDVRKLIVNKLLELYQEDASIRETARVYSIDHLQAPIDQLASTPVTANGYLHDKRLQVQQLRMTADTKDRLHRLLQYRQKTRSLMGLEFFTRPSEQPIDEVDYDEKKEDKCLDFDSFSFYDINAYLNGEEVKAYSDVDESGNREELDEEYKMPAVPPEVARKRLVFFVASDDRLSHVKPYCYHLDQLEKDLGTRLYSDSCDARGWMGDINRGFSNPLFKLSFETNVYVRLSKLLKALYQTQNQAFLLIPTAEIVPRTASLSTAVYHLAVSGDHCQEGTDKRVYRIVVCGRGTDRCYPLRGDIQFRLQTNTRVSDNDFGGHTSRYSDEIAAAQYEQEVMSLEDEEADVLVQAMQQPDSESDSDEEVMVQAIMQQSEPDSESDEDEFPEIEAHSDVDEAEFRFEDEAEFRFEDEAEFRFEDEAE